MALCCLDTLAAMTLAPAVTDVVLPPQSRVKARRGPARAPDLALAEGFAWLCAAVAPCPAGQG
jgi:hypothetical protein